MEATLELSGLATPNFEHAAVIRRIRTRREDNKLMLPRSQVNREQPAYLQAPERSSVDNGLGHMGEAGKRLLPRQY
jgi:hypothetical protein